MSHPLELSGPMQTVTFIQTASDKVLVRMELGMVSEWGDRSQARGALLLRPADELALYEWLKERNEK